MMWMYIDLSCFKKKIVHSSSYKVLFKSITSLSKCRCDLFIHGLKKTIHPSPYKVPFKRVYITLKMWMWSIIHGFKKKFIHHLTKCHSKVLHHFQNADVIYYPCFKKKIHPLPYKSAIQKYCITFKMRMWSIIHGLKKEFIHHLTKCHSKVLHYFQNVDVIYYPCLKNKIHPSPYKVRFKSLTSLFKMQMYSVIDVSQIFHPSPSNCHSKVLHHSLSKCGCNL
jgi:hypothetical protein